jgi:hypothetical protein
VNNKGGVRAAYPRTGCPNVIVYPEGPEGVAQTFIAEPVCGTLAGFGLVAVTEPQGKRLRR